MQQDGAVAPTKVKLRHGDTLIVDTLVGTVQLNALRRFLAEGFQIHLQQNPLMHQIFNFEPREQRAERLSPLEKKLYRFASFHDGLRDQKADWPVWPVGEEAGEEAVQACLLHIYAQASNCNSTNQCVCICNITSSPPCMSMCMW